MPTNHSPLRYPAEGLKSFIGTVRVEIKNGSSTSYDCDYQIIRGISIVGNLPPTGDNKLIC